MTTDTIICAKTEPLCYRPGCEHEAMFQCDYRLDQFLCGCTCDLWMCLCHAVSRNGGLYHCTGHQPPKEQARMAL